MKISPKMKKILLFNSPYVIIFFIFWRIYCLCPFLPYNSIAVAFVGTVIIRLVVYMNGKDEKNIVKMWNMAPQDAESLDIFVSDFPVSTVLGDSP